MAYTIDSFPGRKVNIKGEPHLYFGGTSYLGLQTDDEFQGIFINNIKRYGTNYGASRKSNLQIAVFEEAEHYLTHLVGCESTLTLSSGYLAGQFVSQAFHDKHHQLFYAPNTHAALYQAKIKPYTTFTALNIAVREHLNSNENSKTPVVFVDAIDFSGCNYPHFDALRTLPLDEVILVVDDSHGIGIVGEDGGGVYKSLAQFNVKELLVCCSLGKGFAIQAGAIFGTNKRIERLKDTAFFGGASPAAPAAMATLLDARAIYKERRALLNEHIQHFTDKLELKKKFHFMEAHPAFTFSDVQLSEYLEANRIIVTNFPYPDEDAQIMSRIILSAGHKKKDIDYLLKWINILPKI